MTFFHLNIEFLHLFSPRRKRLLSILFIVDARLAIIDSYVSDSLSYIVAKQISGRVCNDRPSFSQYGCLSIM